MKLISLKTKNFKRLGTFECSFTDGLNVIIGPNAHGKSTVLRAVLFALYGTGALPGKEENITTWGEKGYQVELTFSRGDDEYVVVRTGSKAEIHCNGKQVASGKSPATKYIEDLLGLTHHEYKTFSMATQHNIGQVLTEGATSLSRKIEQFSGLGLIDQVQQVANERARKAAAMVEVLADLDPEEPARKEQEIQAASDQIQKLEDESIELQSQRDALQAEEVPTSDLPHPDELEKKKSTYQRAEQRVRELRIKAKSRSEALEQLKGMAPAEAADASELQEKMKTLKAQVTKLRQLVSEGSNQRQLQDNAQKAYEAAQEKLSALKPIDTPSSALAVSLESAKQVHQAARDEVNRVDREIKAAKKTLDEGVCPTCHRAFEEHEQHLLESRERIKTLELEWPKAKQASEDSHAEVQEWESRYLAVLEKEAELTRRQKAVEHAQSLLPTNEAPSKAYLAELNEELDTVNEQRAKVASQIEQLEEARQSYENYQHRLVSAVAREGQVYKELGEAEHALEGLEPVSDEVLKEARQDQADIAEWKSSQNHKIQLINAEIRSLADRSGELERAWSEDKRQLQQLISSLEQKAQAEKEADQYKRLSTFLRNSRERYLKEVWDLVLAVASEQVKQSSQGLITAVGYKDGSFLYEEKGLLCPVEECSGAQRGYIGVAVRIGLCRALYGRDNAMMFDEPTESMTEDNAVGLTGALAAMGSQTILITHRETDQALANNVITIGI